MQQKKVTNIREWRQTEAIWLREKLRMSGEQVAQALNYRVQTVHLLWHKWLHQGMSLFAEKRSPGGRNNAHMSREEEERFLTVFLEKAASGGIVTIREIKESYEHHIGKQVAESTIYRLLHRHGWRKITPRKKHPKSDPEAQGKIKKTPA
jgi:transposase